MRDQLGLGLSSFIVASVFGTVALVVSGLTTDGCVLLCSSRWTESLIMLSVAVVFWLGALIGGVVDILRGRRRAQGIAACVAGLATMPAVGILTFVGVA